MLPDAIHGGPHEGDGSVAPRATLRAMPQIHLHAEPGDYAPLVLLPGDPIRARRIAERFDGGIENARMVNENRGLNGWTGRSGGELGTKLGKT